MRHNRQWCVDLNGNIIYETELTQSSQAGEQLSHVLSFSIRRALVKGGREGSQGYIVVKHVLGPMVWGGS